MKFDKKEWKPSLKELSKYILGFSFFESTCFSKSSSRGFLRKSWDYPDLMQYRSWIPQRPDSYTQRIAGGNEPLGSGLCCYLHLLFAKISTVDNILYYHCYYTEAGIHYDSIEGGLIITRRMDLIFNQALPTRIVWRPRARSGVEDRDSFCRTYTSDINVRSVVKTHVCPGKSAFNEAQYMSTMWLRYIETYILCLCVFMYVFMYVRMYVICCLYVYVCVCVSDR